MKFYSLKEGVLNAQCDSCSRILAFRTERYVETSAGFDLNPPVGMSCTCGQVHHSVVGKVQAGIVESKPIPQGAGRIVCPHCQVQGRVTTKAVKVKKGVSGGKATAALLTGGWSLLATGLARKESVTEAHCGSCGMTWHIG